jgi:hypothetical protein
MALVVFFCSVEYDLDAVADEIGRLFNGVVVVGSTTAGEIGPLGYLDHSLTGASFPASSFTVAHGRIDALQEFDAHRAKPFGQDLIRRLEDAEPRATADNTFALLLIDGLSVREEPVARALQSCLAELPLVGGSAGDGLAFAETRVYCDGAFRTDSAVVVLVTTELPFRVFKTQHFVPSDQRVVVTSADAEHRIIRELDGWPAVEGYARMLDETGETLDPMRFAQRPVVVLIDGANYVRSIQKANDDGSLTLFCAIEEGVVLRAAIGVDLVENLTDSLAGIRAEIGPPQLVIGYDCILRKLEMTQRGLVESVEAVMHANNVVGFSTYGEQYLGVHVNQTLTGVAIGEAGDG